MKKTKVILALSTILFASSICIAKPIIVAVIDTGIASDLKGANFLCKMGHKDFTGTGIEDHHGHGTHISGLIDQYAKDIVFKSPFKIRENTNTIEKLLSTKIDYCQVIIKYYDPAAKVDNNRYVKALQYAINLKVDIINYSGGGTNYVKEEEFLIKKALRMGIKVVVAAGNEYSNIDKSGKCYYPACLDPRLYVVGNLSENLSRTPSSNYGTKVNTWLVGTNKMSLLPDHRIGRMTGTSQSAAVKTGMMVHEMLGHR